MFIFVIANLLICLIMILLDKFDISDFCLNIMTAIITLTVLVLYVTSLLRVYKALKSQNKMEVKELYMLLVFGVFLLYFTNVILLLSFHGNYLIVLVLID